MKYYKTIKTTIKHLTDVVTYLSKNPCGTVVYIGMEINKNVEITFAQARTIINWKTPTSNTPITAMEKQHLRNVYNMMCKYKDQSVRYNQFTRAEWCITLVGELNFRYQLAEVKRASFDAKKSTDRAVSLTLELSKFNVNNL